jgi:DNA-binding CsgD family transcriptional regulator
MSLARQEAAVRTLQTELDAAVVDASRWPAVADALAGAVEGVGTIFIPFEASKRAPWLVHSESVGELVDVYIKDGWYKRDLRELTIPIIRRRGFVTDYDVGERDQLRKRAFYADYIHKLKFGTFIGIQIPTADGEWCGSIQRPFNSGPPDASTLERVPLLRQMMVDAARASHAIGAASLENWRSHFEGPDRGFALLDREGGVDQLNGAAESLLAPFLRAHRELLLPDSRSGARLAELVRRACAETPRTPLPPPLLLPIAAGRSLTIDVVPLPSALRHFYLRAVAIMVVRLAETPVIGLAGKLIQTFGLTPAEARLAERIGTGEPLRNAADAEGITYETARTRLKSIFDKTNVTRQPELAVLVTKISEGG